MVSLILVTILTRSDILQDQALIKRVNQLLTERLTYRKTERRTDGQTYKQRVERDHRLTIFATFRKGLKR